MRTVALALLLTPVLVSSLLVAPAYALRPNTYVASYGADSGACSYSAPCRTFAYALSQVQTGGVVAAIDSAGNSPFTIAKAVTITAPPGVAPLISVPSGGTAITINVGPNDAVSLRGLTLDGIGVGQNGIVFNSGQSLTVEDCVVRNMTLYGLLFSSTVTTLQTLAVSNSHFNDSVHFGIFIEAQSSGGITASIDRAAFYGNADTGLFVEGQLGTGAITVAVTDSVAANGGIGFGIDSFTSQSVSGLSLTRSLAVGNAVGLSASRTNATIWLAQSTVTGNGSGFSAAGGGVIKSYGDNNIAAANGANTGSLSSVAKQ